MTRNHWWTSMAEVALALALLCVLSAMGNSGAALWAAHAEMADAPTEDTLWINGSGDAAVLIEDEGPARLTWEVAMPVLSQSLTVYDSANQPVFETGIDADARDFELDHSDFAFGVYTLELIVECEPQDEPSQLCLKNAFELRARHETLYAPIAMNRYLLAYIDGSGAVCLANGHTGTVGDVVIGDDVPWQDVVQVAVGSNHVVGLTAAGTVVGAGSNATGQLNCIGLESVRWIVAGDERTACVMDDGSIKLFGTFSDAQYALSLLTDLDRLSLSQTHVVALLRDGSAQVIPLYDGQHLEAGIGVEDWRDLVQVSAGYGYTLGLKADGRVCYAGPEDGYTAPCALWTDMTAICAENGYALGLRPDGTVISQSDPQLRFVNTDSWKDIAYIAGAFELCAGLHADGSLELSGT